MSESIISVFRSDAISDRRPKFHEFHVPREPGMTVLSALIWIQDHLDGTLAFRLSCRGAVCGSCAMGINGEIDLACRKHVSDLPVKIVLEPLPNLPILKV